MQLGGKSRSLFLFTEISSGEELLCALMAGSVGDEELNSPLRKSYPMGSTSGYDGRMEAWELIVAAIGGVVLGGVGAFMLAGAMARAKSAALETMSESARAEAQAIGAERDALRASLNASEKTVSFREATIEGFQTRLQESETRNEQLSSMGERLRGEVTKLTSDLRSMQTTVAEREEKLREVRASFEQAKQLLADTFKSTGAEVMRQLAEDMLSRAKQQFDGQRQLGEQSLEERKRAIEELLKPLRDELSKQERLVKELGEKREGDAKSLESKLMQIAELQQKASTAAQTLSSALRDNRQRGRWGEVSLKNIVELAGLADNVDFFEQSTVSDEDGARLRPDMQIRLPGGRLIPVDSKVPMDAYLDSLNAELPESERIARRMAHAKALKGHVRTLASKDYAQAIGGEVEVTVLFVPFESGLIAALEEDASIFQEALERKVIITTASTLLALLRTCAIQWQQAKLNENARLIGDEARELLKRIVTFSEYMQKIGERLEGVSKAYNDAVGSYNGRLFPSATKAAHLAGELEQVPEELEPVGTAIREVRLPSLESREK